MMKKVLCFALVTVSLVLGGCIKDNDTYKHLKPVMAGINIYDGASRQHSVSQQQAQMGLRLAMLVAEADAQGKSIDEVKAGTSNTLLKTIMLGAAKIEQTATGYEITFNSNYTDIDNNPRQGVILVNTNGAAVLKEATEVNPWVVTFKDQFVLGTSAENTNSIVLSGGSTNLYFDEMSGEYMVDMQSQTSYYNSYKELVSDWNGRFSILPENTNFTYTDCAGKKFVVNGSASGLTFNSYDGVSGTRMSFRITAGEYYTASSFRKSTVDASLIDNYDLALYPSRSVKIEWDVNSSNQQVMTISYNGYTVIY